MLILSRMVGEKIMIGEDICLVVQEIQGGKVRLGIEAPKSVPIYREELLANNPPPGGLAGRSSKKPK